MHTAQWLIIKMMKTFQSQHETHSWYAGTGGRTTGIGDVGDFGVGGNSGFTGTDTNGSRGDCSGFGGSGGGGSGFTDSVFGSAGAAAARFVIWICLLRRGSRNMLTMAGIDPAVSSDTAVSSAGVARVVVAGFWSSW